MPHTIDYLGTVVLGGALTAIVLAASLGGTSYRVGLAGDRRLVPSGVALLVAFPFVERRASEPILPTRLLSNRVFAVTSAVGFIIGFALFGAVTYMPLFLQVVSGATPDRLGTAAAAADGRPPDHLDRLRADHHAHGPLQGLPDRRHGRDGHRPVPALDARRRLQPLTIFLTCSSLGLGLGMVMQVLVLAVQNAVDYADLGVATSGATLFRSIGGALGTAALGACSPTACGTSWRACCHPRSPPTPVGGRP